MASSKIHYVEYGKDKKNRENKKRIERTKRKCEKKPCSDHGKYDSVPNHDLAKRFQVSTHAAERYAERVFGLKPRDVSREQLYKIAKAIRETLPEFLINEARYNIVDNFYAVVNNGLIVTVIQAGKR